MRDVQYVRIGVVDSKEEEGLVIAEVEAGRIEISRLVELGKRIQRLDKLGWAAERAAWIATVEPSVVVHTGRRQKEEPTRRGGIRIWAAVELDEDGVCTLLKIAAYDGDPADFANHMTDALDRYRRGKRYL